MAVYTDIENDELNAFIAEYDVGNVVAYKGIAEGVENSNYLVQTEQDNFILTLYEKRVNPDDLPFFLGLLDHLAEKDFPCPTPVHGRDGLVLRHLAGRPAAMVSFLKGVWHRKPRTVHCADVGRAMARLALAGQDYEAKRTNALTLPNWRPLFESCDGRADSVAAGLNNEIEQELDRLEDAWPTDLPTGVIHADMFPDNVFFLGDNLSGVIDFYFACNDFLAYEIAVCLNAWCFEADRQFNVTKARHMLQAYQQIRPLSQDEMLALPILARGAALRFLLTRLYDWLNTPAGALVRPHDPLQFRDYLRFHKGIKGLAAYGLEGS
jgi:homoserine kinase type II